MPIPASIRFWKFVKKELGGCWIWVGRTTSKGYGNFHGENNIDIYAHRFSWELKNGSIPKGKHICHKCDVRNCVNPDHLFLGTNEDNRRDAIIKGRVGILTEREVIEIYTSSKPTNDLAYIYGVSSITIWKIKNGKTWNWLTDYLEDSPEL